jgi:hypothetical protein
MNQNMSRGQSRGQVYSNNLHFNGFSNYNHHQYGDEQLL